VTERENLPGSPRNGYEVWFLTLTDRASGQGFWIRSTTGARGAAVWFARFDPSDPSRTFGIHRRNSTVTIAGDRFDVRIGECSMASGTAVGRIQGAGHEAAWSLAWPTGAETYRLLPAWMYRGSLVPTKPYSPNVDARVSGTITVDGERLAISQAPAQQGHLIGKRHAERWAWAHCGDFDGDHGVVHALTAQGRRGPALTPFVTSVGVLWDGRWLRFTKVGRRRDFSLGRWKIDMADRRYRLTGRIEAPARDMIRARYEDPDGTERWCHNSEIASSRLALFERTSGGFEQVARFESRGTTHAEWAGRTPAAAVEREHVDLDAAGSGANA
jgi:Tocopherol cyclase